MSVNGYAIERSDEGNHATTGDANFNESVYVNGFELARGYGGWMRIGNRPGEGHAEAQVCLYLPDGRVACQFQRPELSANNGFEAGGLSYTVETPFEAVSMQYRGDVMLLDDPELLRDARTLFKTAPRAAASVDMALSATSPVHGGTPVDDAQPTWYGRDFSYGHFFQQMHSDVALTVGDESWSFSGEGWRDHSWGPRYWTNIYFYRLLIANFGPDHGMTLLKITDREGVTRRHGVLQVDGEYETVTDMDLVTHWTDRKDPRAIELGLRTERRAVRMHGEIEVLAPLSNRRKLGEVWLRSRIAEGLTRWRWDQMDGIGMTEYIEFLEDGEPVGYPQ